MKRPTGIAVVILAALALTACVTPPWMTNGGFTKARTPNRTSITVANPSNIVQGQDMIRATDDWNRIAGWRLFDVAPLNDQYWLVNADVRFGIMTPIGPSPTDRRAFWVDPVLNADGTVHHCNIWFDPTLYGWNSAHPDTVSHEIGHCLGYIGNHADANLHCDPNLYQGVMSYCRFGFNGSPFGAPHQPPWWDGTDVQMITNSGYR